MGRLKAAPHRLSAVKPHRIQKAESRQEYDRQRADVTWRQWYNTTRWRKLRWSILLRDRFQCQWPGCGRIEADTSKLVADHKQPHRGDETLFWADSNLQCLCKPCHDRLKQRAEQAIR